MRKNISRLLVLLEIGRNPCGCWRRVLVCRDLQPFHFLPVTRCDTAVTAHTHAVFLQSDAEHVVAVTL